MANQESDSDRNIKALSPADREELIGSVMKDFTQSDAVLRKWKQNIVTYYELYQMVQKKKHYSGLANIFVPETLRAVETIVGKIYQMIFSQPNWLEFAGRDNNGDEGPAIALTQLVRYQMDENNFKARVMDSIRQMVIAGLTVRKVLWDFQEVSRQKLEYDKTTGQGSPTKVTETIKDTWTFEPVDLLTFQISDISVPYNDLQKAEWIGEEYRTDKSWIRKRAKKGWFSDVEKDKLDDAPKDSSTSSATNDVDARLQAGGYTKVGEEGKVVLMERWGLLKCSLVYTPEEMTSMGFDAEDVCEAVVVIANGVAILKLEKNPFWHGQKPYVACPYVPKEFELPGLGVAQIGQSMQEEINDTRNQTMDNKTLILATMWLKSRASGIKNDELMIRPNGVIMTNDMNGLVPLRPPIVYGHGLNIEGVAKNDLREAVGASSNLQGIAQSGVDTATESTQINREAMGRLILSAQLYCELVLKPTFIFAEFLNYQFYDHIKAIRIIGPTGVKFRPLKPEEIAGGSKDVIIKIALDAVENPSVMRQQLMNFFTGIQEMPPQAIQFHYKLLDKIYGMFFNGHTLDELYPNPNQDPEDILSPEDERDCILAEQKVLAQPAVDDMEYIKYHEQEFGQMKYALNPNQFNLYKNLIMSYYTQMQQKAEFAHTQMIMQEMIAAEEGGKGKGSGSGQSTQQPQSAPSVASQARAVGG